LMGSHWPLTNNDSSILQPTVQNQKPWVHLIDDSWQNSKFEFWQARCLHNFKALP
jgi:hypothetical protein